MSTADSQLVSSSAMAEDLTSKYLRKMRHLKRSFVGRFAVIIISLIALFLAMTPDSSVLGLVSYAWAGFGAAFGPAIVMSLYWSRMNRNGALAGIVVGGGQSYFEAVHWRLVRRLRNRTESSYRLYLSLP
ncbi:hypothetical protein OK016_27670 [Vibrio chagasii]|nr:hypothetical protein [Vibrio chagasii]